MAGENLIAKALQVARQTNPSGFYSKAAEEALKLAQAKGTPEQMRAMLLKQGVKPDELKWTGFDQWAAGKKQITRDEAADFLKKNAVPLEERTLTSTPPRAKELENIDRSQRELTPQERDEYERITSGHAPVKFQEYSLPGGENYRELLLKHPNERLRIESEMEKQYGPNKFNWPTDHPLKNKYKSNPTYQSRHWDDPNVLAHLRMAERTDPQGRKVLHLEELQSDWGQAGREKGFNDPSTARKFEEEIASKRAELERLREDMQQRENELLPRTNMPVFRIGEMSPDEFAYKMQQYNENRYYDIMAHPELNAARGRINDLEDDIAVLRINRSQSKNIPTAPFVESTPKWTDLALKRALIEAERGGHEAIAWTPGAEQAARYPGGGAEAEAKRLVGMQGYYDRVVPGQLQKLAKGLDPEARIGTIDMPVGERTIPMQSLDITPMMREKIKQGLPLFTAVPAAVAAPALMGEGEQPQPQEQPQGFAGGGAVGHALRLIQDQFPTHYMPHVGRQVMAGGGLTENIPSYIAQPAIDYAESLPRPTPPLYNERDEVVQSRAPEPPKAPPPDVLELARKIMGYERMRDVVAQQSPETQGMTHLGDKPRAPVEIDAPLLGGKTRLGEAPYDVAGPISNLAQTAYSAKTLPLYMNPVTAIPAAAADVGEGVAEGSPVGVAMGALGVPGRGIKAALMGSSALMPSEAQAGVPLSVAKALTTIRNLPKSEAFNLAVKNTPGASIRDEHLVLPVVRSQKPEQAGMESVRGGVFYLPQGSSNARYYNFSADKPGVYYGGPQKISEETAVSNPFFVKGATGGAAPEAALKQIYGKENFEQMNRDMWRAINTGGLQRDLKEEVIGDFLQKHAPSMSGLEAYILENSKKGNQLRYALQEAVAADAARREGYDSILGYSMSRKLKEPFISELFDVRERSYPTNFGGAGDIWPQFLPKE